MLSSIQSSCKLYFVIKHGSYLTSYSSGQPVTCSETDSIGGEGLSACGAVGVCMGVRAGLDLDVHCTIFALLIPVSRRAPPTGMGATLQQDNGFHFEAGSK